MSGRGAGEGGKGGAERGRLRRKLGEGGFILKGRAGEEGKGGKEGKEEEDGKEVEEGKEVE
jgi:serine-aspartate repeat-containing protein C/D/E